MSKKKVEKFYGVVEGFFSRPLPIWSFEERLNTLKFLTRLPGKLNLYLYCPKGDEFVVQKWSKLYPKKILSEFEKTIKFCLNNDFQFAYGLNPDFRLLENEKKFENYMEKILMKLTQLNKLGCKIFCILFDDIPFLYDLEERIHIAAEREIANTMIKVINTLYARLTNQIDSLFFCAHDYYFTKRTVFTEYLKENLNKEIYVMWTGGARFVKNAATKNFTKATNVVGADKKLLLWSNYPSNNCEPNLGTFHLGGFNNPSMETFHSLSGILVNPMREPYASFPFFATFADYTNNPEGFSREKSWIMALEKLLGRDCQNYNFCLREFSSTNAADTQPKFLSMKLNTLKTVKSVKTLLSKTEETLNNTKDSVSNDYFGNLFTKSVSAVLNKGLVFLSISKAVLGGQSILLQAFIRFDKFPTIPNIPRYFPEVLEIIDARLFLLPPILQKVGKKKLVKFRSVNTAFQKIYPGQKKLHVTNEDFYRLKSTIKELINLERDLFLAFLNNKNIDGLQKVKVLSLRQNINRFNSKKALVSK